MLSMEPLAPMLRMLRALAISMDPALPLLGMDPAVTRLNRLRN